MGGPHGGWTTVETFLDRGMAEVGAGVLRSADIPYRIVADDAHGSGLALGLSSPGAELQVPDGRVEDAWVLMGAAEQDGPGPVAEERPLQSSTLSWVAVLAVGGLLVFLFIWELISYLT